MSDLENLYQELIIDHGKNPRNFGKLVDAVDKEGFNPLCGDKIILHVSEKDGVICNAKFEGNGCAISMASASMMLEALLGKNIQDFQNLFDEFHHLVTTGKSLHDNSNLEKLTVFSGVSEFPMRVKCATLAWHTFSALIKEHL